MPHTATASSTGRILVVDDQAANLRVVSLLLGRRGYEVVTAGTGPEALEAARERAPDLFLLDMMMPGMDGFELLAALREEPGLRAAPAVFLTAAHDRDLLLRAFESGAVDYVTKPFMPEELLARVDAHIGLKLARDRLERVARERQELVNLVAHDLKNPLTSVLFASEMLQLPDVEPRRATRYLQVIHDSAQDAVSYIRRYLEGQARAQDARAESAEACLRETVDWLLQRYELQLEASGMRLSILAPEQGGRVAIDPLVLRQVA
ncbi:MAG TPA: response regulator, partial [Thermomonas sp.]|nr:response regulator [Thermomonas sp.]